MRKRACAVIGRIVPRILKEMKDLKKVTHQHLSSLDRRKVWESTAEDSVDQSLGASISNETCESTLSALANELKVFDNTGLNNSGGVAKIRKK